jgi:hypothetical protein
MYKLIEAPPVPNEKREVWARAWFPRLVKSKYGETYRIWGGELYISIRQWTDVADPWDARRYQWVEVGTRFNIYAGY